MTKRAHTYHAEPLEPRRLLTIFINGTGAADVITAERAGTVIDVTINGTPSTRTIGSETDVQINGLGGGDTITVFDMAGLDLTVLGGTGNDALTIGGTGATGSSFEFDATVLSGEAGTDSVHFVDNIGGGNPGIGHRYELAGGVFRSTRFDTFSGGSSTTASHDYDFETVIVTAGSQDSAFSVRALGAETSLQINAGGGGDTLVLNPLATTATITFDGQAAATLPTVPNRVLIEDTLGGGAAGDVYILNDNTFDRTGFGFLIFSNVSFVSLTTHNLGAVVNVNSVLQGSGNTEVKASVVGGAGDDVFNVGNGDYDLNIIGLVFVDGAGGTDSLSINDAADIGSDGYDLSDNLFEKTNMIFGLNFLGIEEITVTANGAGNVFDVSTATAQTVNLFGGGGNDTFLVTPRPGSRLNLDGGGPTTAPGDTLVFEAAEPAGSAIFISGTYHFESAGDVVITGVETFPLPPAPPSVPDLRAEDDSGISFTDNITSDNQPTFTGTAPANLAVVLRAGSTSLGTGTASAGGAWSILSGTLLDGTHPITAAARVQSSGLTGPRSAPLSVTIDTAAPATPAVAPDLATNSDTGLSFTDNVTRDNTPQIDGTVPANDIVRLFVDGVLSVSQTNTVGGVYRITTPVLANGSRQIVVKFEDLAGNESGLSPALNVTIDTVAPAAPSVAPDMTAATDTGVSSTDNITRDATPTFTGARPADVAVLMTQGNVIFGQVLTVGSTSYSITPSTLDDGSYNFAARFRDVAGNDSSPGPTVGVTIDTVAPTLTNQTFNFLTSQNVRFAFSEDVGATLAPADFSLTATPGGAVPAASIALAYTANTATFTFPGFAGGVLPDADYRAKIEGGSAVTDVAGNAFAGTELLFFFLNGDANRDRLVNLADFNILAANFGQSPRDFSQADFNYDGRVNLADFNILAGRFGQALAPAAAAAAGGVWGDAPGELADEDEAVA